MDVGFKYSWMKDCINHMDILFNGLDRDPSQVNVFGLQGMAAIQRVFGRYGENEVLNPKFIRDEKKGTSRPS